MPRGFSQGMAFILKFSARDVIIKELVWGPLGPADSRQRHKTGRRGGIGRRTGLKIPQ